MFKLTQKSPDFFFLATPNLYLKSARSSVHVQHFTQVCSNNTWWSIIGIDSLLYLSIFRVAELMVPTGQYNSVGQYNNSVQCRALIRYCPVVGAYIYILPCVISDC